jgi:hypothetical protein
MIEPKIVFPPDEDNGEEQPIIIMDEENED